MDALGLAMVGLPLAEFGAADWGVVALYFAAMIYFGVVAARKDQNTREYFQAHRSIPTWAVSISIVATSLSAATFVGVPDLAFNQNLCYLILNVGGLLAVGFVAVLFVPRLYRAGTVTIYGFLEQRFGRRAMVAVSLMFLAGRMLASSARLFIAAIPLCLLMFASRRATQFEPASGQLVLAILMIGGLGTFYTAFGGIRTVIWIDVIQFFIVIGAAVLTIGVLLHAIPLSSRQLFSALADPASGPGGHSKLFFCDLSRDSSRPYTLMSAIFGATLLNMAAYGVDQDLAQRFLVARSVTRGALSLIWAQLISIIVVGGFLLIGLLLYVFYRRPDLMGGHAPMLAPGNQGAYPWFLLHELPTVLSGIAIVGFFAIAQGSMDSAINALASSAVADIYEPWRRRRGAIPTANDALTPKLAVALMGACMSLLAIGCVFLYDKNNRTLIDFALGILAFAFTGMLGVFLAALLTRRGNDTSVICALLVGVGSFILMQPPVLAWWTGMLVHAWTGRGPATPWRLASTWWMPIGTSLSFLACICGRPASQRAIIAPMPGRESVAGAAHPFATATPALATPAGSVDA